MDARRLIEEVKKRPVLWDIYHPDHKDRKHTPLIWQQVADALNCDVHKVKAKWKNLRDAFRAEVRRAQRRAEKHKNLNRKDPRRQGTSKWIYFVPMSFMVNARRAPFARTPSPTNSESESQHQETFDAEPSTATVAAAAAISSSGSEDNNGSSVEIKQEEFDAYMNDDENDERGGSLNESIVYDETMYNDDEDQEELFHEFQSLATPQAMRRLSHSISVANAEAEDKEVNCVAPGGAIISIHSRTPSTSGSFSAGSGGSGGGGGGGGVVGIGGGGGGGSVNTPNPHCKCANRVDEQVHFLEDLEREEENLIKSTRQDMTRCKDLHVGDSDYNFLISFLPLMKKMSDLQNVHFRAKMSELLVHTMGMAGQSSANSGNTIPAAAAATMNQVLANPYSGFNPALAAGTPSQPQVFILQQAQPPISSATLSTPPVGNPQVTTSSNKWN